MNYHHAEGHASESLPVSYNFTKDFDDIARPGLIRYLEHLGCEVGPEEGEDPSDFDLMDSSDEAREYLRQLRGGLEEAQESLEFGEPPLLYPDITSWSRESAVALTNSRLDDMLGSTDDGPIDFYRAVYLGTEMARKRGLDVGPEAVAYAVDRLKSKIERDVVYNPIAEVHDGFLSYRFLKEQYDSGAPILEVCDGKVVYFDVYKRRRERLEQAKAEAPKQECAEQAERQTGARPSKFALTWVSNLVLNLDDEWLFKGLVPKVGVVSVFGDSRSFKTFLLIHLAMCAALGRDCGQHKCKNPGAVVYVAAEDPKGVEKRIVGYCMAYGISQSDVRIAIVSAAPNLGSVRGDANELARAIEAELAGKGYGDPAAIVIDTLNQTLGDAEENGIGMQAFLINAGLMANGFACPVFAANHVGHAEKDRERGGSQIKGNTDTRLLVERLNEEPTIVDGVKTFETMIHAHKVKNGEDRFSLKVILRQFVLGQDEDGDYATTLVVDSIEAVEADTKAKATPAKTTSKMARTRRAFIEAYHQLANDVAPTAGLDKRSQVRKVNVEAIRDHMRDCGMLDRYDGSSILLPSAKVLFSTVKGELIAPGKDRAFIERNGLIWALYPERPFAF